MGVLQPGRLRDVRRRPAHQHKNGTATLRAALVGTDLSAELVVCISDAAPSAQVEDMQYFNGDNTYFARLSDGTLWRWGQGLQDPPRS